VSPTVVDADTHQVAEVLELTRAGATA
jgi:hypothetical protein